MPDLLKIGRSSQDPKTFRVKSLNNTALARAFQVEYQCLVYDEVSIEKAVHGRFQEHNAGKEFFRSLGLGKIVDTIRELGTPLYEDFFSFPQVLVQTKVCDNCGAIEVSGTECKECGFTFPSGQPTQQREIWVNDDRYMRDDRESGCVDPIGWVYIMSHPDMPDLLKIGKSSKDPERGRLRELSDVTGVPRRFELEYAALVACDDLVESSLHHKFQNDRYGKEFFKGLHPRDVANEIWRYHDPKYIVDNIAPRPKFLWFCKNCKAEHVQLGHFEEETKFHCSTCGQLGRKQVMERSW